MEMLSGITAFLNIINLIFSITRNVKIDSNHQKESISKFLIDVGHLLLEVANEFENSKYPHDKCAIMFEYMNGLKNHLRNKMEEEQVEKLAKLIEESYRIEQLLGQLNQLTFAEKSYNIDMLRSIAGRFIGVSRLL